VNNTSQTVFDVRCCCFPLQLTSQNTIHLSLHPQRQRILSPSSFFHLWVPYVRHRGARKQALAISFVRPWELGRTRRPHPASVAGHLGGWRRLPAASSTHGQAIIPFDHGQGRGVGDWPVEYALREYTCMGFNAVQRALVPTAGRPAPAAPHACSRAHTALGSLHRCTPPRRPHTSVRPWAQEMSSATWRSMATPGPIRRSQSIVPAVSTYAGEREPVVRADRPRLSACLPSRRCPLFHAFVLFGQSFSTTWRVQICILCVTTTPQVECV
jgi:hypothetical protein